MSTLDDTSELPTHYGQTTLSGYYVQRPSVIGEFSFPQPTRPPRRRRPASMNWPPNRELLYRDSPITTSPERSNIQDEAKRTSTQTSSTNTLIPPKLHKSQNVAEEPEGATDYFNQLLKKTVHKNNEKTLTSVPVDPRTGREYAMPPAANKAADQPAYTNTSTSRVDEAREGLSKGSSRRPVHAYARSMSFYDAMELRRAKADAQARSAAQDRQQGPSEEMSPPE